MVCLNDSTQEAAQLGLDKDDIQVLVWLKDIMGEAQVLLGIIVLVVQK